MTDAARVIQLRPLAEPVDAPAKRARPQRKPLTGSVEPRGNGHRAVWRAEGKKETQLFDSRDAACDFLDEMAVNVRRGAAPTKASRARTKFTEFAWAWYEDETRDRAKKETFIRLHLIPAFGDQAIGEITHKDVQKWINKSQRDPAADCEVCEELQGELGDDDARCRKHKGTKPASARSIIDHYVLLGTMMRAAERQGYLPNGCPVGKRLHQLPAKNKRMVILNARQEDFLLEVAEEQFTDDFVMIHLDTHTGLRLGELMALTRDQYDGKALTIDRARKATGKVGETKTGRVRKVALFPCCVTLLNAHLAGHDSPLIFPGARGAMQVPTNWRKRVWYPLVKAAGLEDLDLHFHDLRHTHCSNLLAASWEVTVVAERLGHASTKMTLDVYGHPLADRQQKLMETKGLRPR